MNLEWLIGGLAAGIVLYGLHRVGLWLERRGWLHYSRKSRRTRASLAVAAAFDPNARRILEIQECDQYEQDEAGDDGPRVRAPDV